MKKNIIFFSFVCTLLLLSSCSLNIKKHVVPFKSNSYQSRDYNSTKEIAFKSVMSVFQDMGFIVITADINTGLIIAENAAKSDFLSRIWFGLTEIEQTKANAFIEQIGTKTRVRLNFIKIIKISSEGGQSDRKDQPILNKKMYQNTFERIESAILMRSKH